MDEYVPLFEPIALEDCKKGDTIQLIKLGTQIVLQGDVFGSEEGLRVELHLFSPPLAWAVDNGFTLYKAVG